jgi:hypothetical protein
LTPNDESAPRQELATRGPDIAVATALSPLDLPPRLPFEDRERIFRRHDVTLNPEAVLGDLLEECHFIMREVALRCAAQATDSGERIAFVNTAMHCAKTGASVAKAMAKLRSQPMDEDRKLAVTLEADKRLIEIREAKSGKQ